MAKVSAKQKTIDATQHLMTGRGYSATTMDDIIDLAGVSKGSVYHAFKSKEELAIAALEAYAQAGWDIVADGPSVNMRDPIKRAITFVRHVEKKAPELWQHGCLLGSVSLEVADRHPALHERIDGLFRRFEAGMAGVFAPAVKAAGVKGIRGKDLAAHLLSIIEGSIILAKSHREPKRLTDGVRHFRRYLEMLLGVK